VQTYASLDPQTRPLPDARLHRRLHLLIDQFTAQPNCSIPQATGHRNDMEAAYAFFANTGRVSPAAIVASCRSEALDRLEGCQRVLALQDTTELNFTGLPATDGLGYTAGSSVRGLLLHSTLLVRPDGLPLGLLTQQLWARDPALKGQTQDRHRRVAEDKESFRWRDHAQAARAALPPYLTVVHVADREGDIDDWLAAPRPAATHLLIRVAQAHRIVVHGPEGTEGKLAAVVRAQAPLGRHTVEVPRADDRPARRAVLTLRVAAVQVQPPQNAPRRAQLRPVPVWVVEAVEEDPPAGEKPVCWRLVSTEPITTLEEAIRAVTEYVCRWRIERFHYVLKQGCAVEHLQLETAARLAHAVAVYSQVAVRLLRLTYLARVEPETPVAQEFTRDEVRVLEGCRQRQEKRPEARVRTIAEAVRVIARLGGHLGRKKDGPPGAKVLWRGLRSLHDRVQGYQIARSRSEIVRNE
jgi:Transposase Tn5 dimerisation domain/Transposase DNA-binding